jgi:AraC-like DNA-binding protein
LGNHYSVWEEGHRREIGTSQAHVLRAGAPLDFSADTGCRVLVANVTETDLPESVVNLNQSESSHPPVSDSIVDFKHPQGSALFHCLAEIWGAVNGSDAITGSPIGLQELEDEYLTKFVLAAQTDPGPVCEPASTKAVSCIEDFLIAHVYEPVSRRDLVEIAGVSIRSLSRGFAKRHGVGPMKFLRQRRLEASYRELLGSDRDSITVTDVAMRLGFNHLGKFALEYKQAFGESPSQTLRR